MATSLIAGTNTVLTTNGSPAQLNVVAGWDYIGSEFYIDVIALAVDAGGKIPDDAHFVFFNNASTPGGGVRLEPTGSSAAGREQLAVDLTKLPVTIVGVVFAAVVYDEGKDGNSFMKTRNIGIRVEDTRCATLVTYNVEPVTGPVTALLLGELYRNKGEWKFRALGQGYTGGLKALASNYGVVLAD